MHETRESQKCTGSKHREPSMRTSNIELAGNVDPSTTTEQLRLRPPENPYNCSEFSSSHNEQSSTLVGCSDVQSWPASLNAEVRFWQPSFFDNDFSLDGFGTSNGRGRPALTLQTPNPNSPHIVEVDHSPAPTFAGSESTLIRIEDYGFGSNWLQHVKELPHVIQQIQDGHDYPRPKHRDERSTGLYDISVDSVLKQETEMSEHSHESELKGVGWHFGSFPLESDTIARANDLGHDLDQPDTYDIITDLATQLDIEQIRSKHSGDDFLPFDKLLTLLRHSDIERVLSQQFLGDAESVNRIAKDICHDNPKTSRRMILATLISIGKVDSIEIFIQKGIYDVNLPLRRYKVHGRRNMILFHRRNDSDDDPPLECLTHWTPHNLDDFCATQYKFIIPFFDMRQDSVHFYRMEDPRSRLPFLEWHIQRKGGYGTVWRAKIHPAHHNYKFKDADESFAVKEIHSTDVKGYEDEVRVLERFSGSQNGHPHLIRLLMAFQHGKQYYLIFPLAQGNLADLWDQKQMSPTSLLHTRWVIGQCLGMADGLKKIHRNYSWFKERNTDVNHLDVDKNRGRHGDIKPENILCFSNPEKTDLRLVISDFGLTRFHSAHSVSNVPPEKVGGLSVTYRPPEFDMKSSISQAYDMWSLGCLYLEFISWFLYGNQGTHENEDTRDKFHKARLSDDLSYDPRSAQDKFFNIYDGKAVLKESVKKWMADLRALDSCAPCIREFLNLIEDDLLQPNPGRRSKIDKFHVKLNRIWEKCKMPEYCVNGALSLEPRDSNFTGSVTGQLSLYHWRSGDEEW
ncbi:kinase-like domain-containing protein [Whalleya microplaca]|nr:kinase-like domain-containing protein [Whalleya microplaca]